MDTSGDMKYLICYMTSQNHVIESCMKLYEWELLIVCQHPAKFGGHKCCDSRDIFLVCQVILQDNVIKFSLTYVKEPIKVSYRAAKLGSHRHCSSGDIIVLVCHLILQDHMAKGLSNFMGESQSR